ncbi:hypothetical protein FB451DRAFT_1359045 [Mycena latifolia]|nr:hypothetical protein FB451DRAFT_1359045 [Mycena latifolia]
MDRELLLSEEAKKDLGRRTHGEERITLSSPSGGRAGSLRPEMSQRGSQWEGCFDKARRSFNNRKRINLIVNNEYNGVYGPEQTTSTVLTVYMVDLGLVNPSGRNGNRPNELYKRE